MANFNTIRQKGFSDYLETALPKLVLAPTFLAAVIFIYGFILWTAWISMTQSALLPSYKIAGGYKITQKVLRQLEKAGVPPAVLEKLQILEKQELSNKKSKFLNKIKNQIGSEQRSRYQDLILKHSYTHAPLYQYKKLFDSDRWIVALKNLVIFGFLFITIFYHISQSKASTWSWCLPVGDRDILQIYRRRSCMPLPSTVDALDSEPPVP